MSLLVSCNGGGLTGSAVGQFESQSIASGEIKEGEIDGAGSFEYWTFDGRLGQQVSIYLQSADIESSGGNLDPVIILRSPSGRIEAYNDDWTKDSLASRVSGQLDESGQYVIVAGGNADSLGRYSLHYCDAVAGECDASIVSARLTSPIADGEIKLNEIVLPGEFDEWTFDGNSGQEVRIDVRAFVDDGRLMPVGYDSTAPVLADAVVDLVAPSGATEVTSDDASGECCNAQISHSLEETGTYTIVAKGFGGYYTGRYTVELFLGDVPPAIAVEFTRSLDYLLFPSADQDMVTWDPEIGVRIQPKDGFEDVDLGQDIVITGLADAISLSYCLDAGCSDTVPVQGHTKFLPEDGGFSQEVVLGNWDGDWDGPSVGLLAPTGDMEPPPAHRIVSFIPDEPLFGDTRYLVDLNPATRVSRGSNEASLLELAGVAQWQFTTSKMTQFILPVTLKYNNTMCFDGPGKGYRYQWGKDGPGVCHDTEETAENFFGTSPGNFNHYWANQSGNRFVMSPIRDRQGNVRKTIHLDRGVDYDRSNSMCTQRHTIDGKKWRDFCPDYPAWRGDDAGDAMPGAGTIIAGMFDFSRYSDIRKKDGSVNILPPRLPSRAEASYGEFLAAKYHHNLYIMWSFGVPENFTFGRSSRGTIASNPTEASLTEGISQRTYLHEAGHGFFGLSDTYVYPSHRKTGADTVHMGSFDIMGDNAGTFTPFSAGSRVQAEFYTPTPLISDDVAADFLYYGEDVIPRTCGESSDPCILYSNNGAQYNIIQVPAIFDRDTKEV